MIVVGSPSWEDTFWIDCLEIRIVIEKFEGIGRWSMVTFVVPLENTVLSGVSDSGDPVSFERTPCFAVTKCD